MSTIQGLDSLNNKLNSMNEEILKCIRKSVLKETKVVQGIAKMNCPANHGELRQSIHAMTEYTEQGVCGIVYTNKKYAAYVEFGTGPKGQQNHEGISPNVEIAYSNKGWAFPADGIPQADAEKYGWPERMYGGQKYYLTSGQAAQPFMYPALKNYEETAKRNITKDINKFLKGYEAK